MKRSARATSPAVDEKWIQRALKRVNGHTIRLIANELLHCNGETWTEFWKKVRATNVLETVETLVIDGFSFDNVDALPNEFEAPNLTTLVLKDTAYNGLPEWVAVKCPLLEHVNARGNEFYKPDNIRVLSELPQLSELVLDDYMDVDDMLAILANNQKLQLIILNVDDGNPSYVGRNFRKPAPPNARVLVTINGYVEKDLTAPSKRS